jgi:excisionase family DNA binding protein
MSNAAANPKRVLTLDQYPPRLRPDQVAAYLGVSANHVANLIRTGALPAVDTAAPGSTQNSYRVTREALSAFEKSRKSL